MNKEERMYELLKHRNDKEIQAINLFEDIEALLQENKKQKEVIDKLELENKVLKEQMVAMVKPNYTYDIR